MEKIDEHKAFGGWQRRYTHASKVCNCDMTFALYVPPQADTQRVPVVYWLSGLTCTDENFVNKAGAQRVAAELGVAVVAPDTSPRGDDVADEDVFDMGKGAGFYVNATQAPWASHYQMYDYVVSELPALLADEFNTTLDLSREAIFGHSMGGHGALVIGLRNIDRFAAISAFSPICAPTEVPWGHKAFPKYLGDDRQAWLAYDATHLLSNADNAEALPPIRVEQGLADNFLDEQLHPHRLEEAAEQVGADVEVNRREGYDHSYFFIASFMEDHLRFLGRHLGV
ncbi:S-formylglutathione hydrolase [Salinisphaera orenii MK-B5]|uniref:S-formylglutathione hydrolase n=1 Tax=Salinisphaera orenii MK-B5 TaxID=856730 RepID=A0A423PEK4_9GAMM|nr:S-formylglutathione hydrolase [Salinisphaera orenii]ROO24014.1 S-formylglutathione hydrolase [Salinisphaera orenii MK-B5]